MMFCTKTLNRNWKKSGFITAVCCLCILGIVAVFLAVASHTFFNTDDYGSLIEYQPGNGLLGILQTSARLTGEAYMQHMGAYTSFFFGNAIIFSIMEGWFSLPGMMVVCNLLLMASLALFAVTAVCSTGLCYDRTERNVALLFAAAVLFFIYDTRAWPEIDNWISGYNAYGLPTTFGLVAASLMCRRAACSKPWAVLAVISAFLGAGGTLQITGGICCILLAILLVKVLQRFAKISDWVIFGASFLGALINVAAPGNYVRRNSVDPTGFHPGIALPFIIQWGNDVWTTMLTHPLTPALLAGIFVLGFHLHERIRPHSWKLGLLLLACVAAPYISAFPVCLGYGGGYFPNRCLWAATVLATLALLTAFFVLGCLTGRALKRHENRLMRTTATVAIVALAILGIARLPQESSTYSALKNLYNGSIDSYCYEVKAVLEELSRQEGPDAKVVYLPSAVEQLNPFYLSPDPTNEMNQYIAAYYGFDSLIYDPSAQ